MSAASTDLGVSLLQWTCDVQAGEQPWATSLAVAAVLLAESSGGH
jgi:hypothetical protein